MSKQTNKFLTVFRSYFLSSKKYPPRYSVAQDIFILHDIFLSFRIFFSYRIFFSCRIFFAYRIFLSYRIFSSYRIFFSCKIFFSSIKYPTRYLVAQDIFSFIISSSVFGQAGENISFRTFFVVNYISLPAHYLVFHITIQSLLNLYIHEIFLLNSCTR